MLTTTTSTTLSSTLPKLTSDWSNWVIWKTRMQIFLGAKKFASHLDNSTPPPQPKPVAEGAKAEDFEKYEKANEKFIEWIQADTEAKHYIISTIPDYLRFKTINCKTVKDLWQAICTEHECKAKMCKMKMLRQIHSERCTDIDDVRAHLAKMLCLREELAATGESLDEANFTNVIMNSLPESYGNVTSIVHTIAVINDRVPTTQQLVAVIEAEYMRRQIANGGFPGSPAPAALYTNPQKLSSSKKKKSKKNVCTNIKCRFRYNHEFEDCRSEGGPLHGQSQPQAENRQNTQGGRDVRQMMRANVVQETEVQVEHAFNITTSFSIADITANATAANPSKRVEVYDSGASCHMSPYIDAFTDFTFINPKPILAADSQTFNAIGKGTVHVTIPNGEESTVVQFRDVLYAPMIAFTLISLSRADSAGYTTVIEDGDLHLLDRRNKDKVIGRIPAKNGLWSVSRPTRAPENEQALLPGNTALPAISLLDLHRCLSYISPSAAMQLVDHKSLDEIIVHNRNVDFREVCALAKIKRLPFPKSRSHPAQGVGDMYSDV